MGDAFDGRFTRDEAESFGAAADQAILLGFSPDGPMLAAPVSVEPESLPDTLKAIDYRSINMQGLLDPASLGALAQAAGLLAWHASHRFCGKCGQPTEMRAGGYKRACTACGTEHFPRTDPVAIMLTVAKDKCILGRGKHFAPGMYSALAGFIEPGETIENAVRRETLEEAGIRLGRVVYHASQPWPFPYSLMIGCYGEALERRHRRRPRGTRGLPLVFARGSPHHAQQDPSRRCSCRRRAPLPIISSGPGPRAPENLAERTEHDPPHRHISPEAQARLSRGNRVPQATARHWPTFPASEALRAAAAGQPEERLSFRLLDGIRRSGCL